MGIGVWVGVAVVVGCGVGRFGVEVTVGVGVGLIVGVRVAVGDGFGVGAGVGVAVAGGAVIAGVIVCKLYVTLGDAEGCGVEVGNVVGVVERVAVNDLGMKEKLKSSKVSLSEMLEYTS